jgi:hypothetical protein
MKYCLILIFFLCVICCNAQSGYRQVKILQIDSTENYYFIHGRCKKAKEKILIISKRVKVHQMCEYLKIKETYSLRLSQFLSEETTDKIPVKPPETFFLREDGYIIWDGISKLPLVSVDINGSCYIK